MSKSESLSPEHDSNNENRLSQRCEFCGAIVDEPHPTRAFIVKLTPPVGLEDGTSLACQVCRIAYRKTEAEVEKHKLHIDNKSVIIFSILFIVSALITLVLLALK